MTVPMPHEVRYLGSWLRSLLNCSGVMQVHWGSLERLGEAGVDTGFRRVLIFCLFGGSSFNE